MTSANNQRYEEFFSDWIAEQKIQARDLQSALESGMDDEYLQTQVLRVLGQYERYYSMRAEAAERNVLAMFCPTWNNPLENAFLWIGGWRPSMIFQLAYAEIGQQLESELAELLRGINSSTLAALSSKQLYQINKLQCETLEEEDKLSDKMAVLQRSMADGPLLSFAQVAFGASSLESVLEGKVQKLQKLLLKADSLRFDTMKRMLEILTPCQSVQILITAAQLHLCLHNKRY